MSLGAFTEWVAEGERWSFRICISTRPLTPLCRGHLINPFVMEYSFPLPHCVRKHTHPHQIQNWKYELKAGCLLLKNQDDVHSKYSLLVIHFQGWKVIHVGSFILLRDDQRGVQFHLPWWLVMKYLRIFGFALLSQFSWKACECMCKRVYFSQRRCMGTKW